jgi:flagellar hook assembly protein FlgD
VTPTPTASIILSCQNPLFISRNRYSPKSDFPRLFARVIQCAAGHFSVMVYNSAGEHIRTLVDDSYRSLGTYEVEWDGKNMNGFYVASGVYLVCFTEPKEVHKAKVLVIR